MSSLTKKILGVATILALFTYGALIAFAGPYTPGQYLDPVAQSAGDCTGPNDADCYVQSAGGASLWSQNGSDIYFDTGNVGIGTDTPGYDLEIAGELGSVFEAPITTGGPDQYTFELLHTANAPSSLTFDDAEVPDGILSGHLTQGTEAGSGASYKFFVGLGGVDPSWSGGGSVTFPIMSFLFDDQAGERLVSYVNPFDGGFGIQTIRSTGGNTFANPDSYSEFRVREETIYFNVQDEVNSNQTYVVFDETQGVTFQFENSGVTDIYTFPRTDGGAGEVLTTDGAGQLSWAAGGGGGSYQLYAENPVTPVTPVASGDNAIALGSEAVASGIGSIAFGSQFIPATFAGPISSGIVSIAIGTGVQALGAGSVALGLESVATADNAVALGSFAIASGERSFAVQTSEATGEVAIAMGTENQANGDASFATGDSTVAGGAVSATFGGNTTSHSQFEMVIGSRNTSYTPVGVSTFELTDRLFVIGNGQFGFGSPSDAFTVLKNGQTGISIDNFEANTNGSMFQVGDGGTTVIGYVDGITGDWVAVSDRRAKENIQDITYGLNDILQLEPKQYDFKRNGERAIGLIAQDVQAVIPEVVSGSEENGYGIAYASFAPVLIKAIQELDEKVIALELGAEPSPESIFKRIASWLGNASNGIETIVAKVFKADRVETDELCVGAVCVTEAEFLEIVTGTNTREESFDDSTDEQEITEAELDPVVNEELVPQSEQNQSEDQQEAVDVLEPQSPDTVIDPTTNELSDPTEDQLLNTPTT